MKQNSKAAMKEALDANRDRKYRKSDLILILIIAMVVVWVVTNNVAYALIGSFAGLVWLAIEGFLIYKDYRDVEV